ncbi:MAG: cyclic di-GMP phosphodiesterase, partial [Campylobacterota bacterium]|nr:cyclic di-GMP phosphodiesterase [Campylobacterota bacterium]
EPLPEFEESVLAVRESGNVNDGWFCAPIQARPKNSAEPCPPVPIPWFSLPLTHRLEYRSKSASSECSQFLITVFGWSQGLRLQPEEWGHFYRVALEPGKLNDDEFEIMKQHSTIGHAILSQKETPLLKLAAEIAYTHHEKYNGKGYPNALTGDDIPLSGAIVAVVDVFDALLNERPYKKAFTLEKTLEIIKNDSGLHFHPKVVEIFMQSLDEILEIKEKFKDV